MGAIAVCVLLVCLSGYAAWKTAAWWVLPLPAAASFAFGLLALQRGPVYQPGGGDVDPVAIYLRAGFITSVVALIVSTVAVLTSRRARRDAR